MLNEAKIDQLSVLYLRPNIGKGQAKIKHAGDSKSKKVLAIKWIFLKIKLYILTYVMEAFPSDLIALIYDYNLG